MTDRMRELALCPWGARLSEDALRLLEARLTTVNLESGEVLLREGETSDLLYVVVEGALRVQAGAGAEGEGVLGRAGTGDLLGEVSALPGRPSATTITADQPSVLLGLRRAALLEVAQTHPEILATLRAQMDRHELEPGARRYRPSSPWILAFLREIALFNALDALALASLEGQLRWFTLLAGETLMVQGGPSYGLFLVVGGRLRATSAGASGAPPLVHETGPGEVAGELAVISEGLCPATVQAVRDCELLALPRHLVSELLARHPAVMMGLSRTLVARLHRTGGGHHPNPRALNIALIPLGSDSPLGWIADQLSAEIQGPVRRISWASFKALGLSTQDLDHLAETGHVVLSEVDPEPTPWSRFCLRQADLVLLVAAAGAVPPRVPIEEALSERLRLPAPPRVHLALVHPPEVALPSGTSTWLDRFPVHAHHHVRADRGGDLARLARLLTGRATAVVLSGGGARGFAHIGVLRALADSGIPIDALAGTSIGAVIAAQRALGWSPAHMIARNRWGWIENRPMSDYTIPFVSVLSGRRFFAMLDEMFGETAIEDLWIPCFFSSTNMNRGVAEYARRGPLRRWLAASMAFPGFGPPRILGGEFHCDGGIVDNLPVVEMRRSCDANILAVDASAGPFLAPPRGVAEFPSSGQVLFRRLFGGPPLPRLPNLLEVLVRSVAIGGERNAEIARAEADLCLRPPVEGYGPFQFESLEEISEAGYVYARDALARTPFP